MAVARRKLLVTTGRIWEILDLRNLLEILGDKTPLGAQFVGAMLGLECVFEDSPFEASNETTVAFYVSEDIHFVWLIYIVSPSFEWI